MGRGGTGGSNHSDVTGLSAKAEASSSSRDQRESVKALSKGWHAHAYKYTTGCARSVQGRGSRVHFRETSQEAMPWSRTEARNWDPGISD